MSVSVQEEVNGAVIVLSLIKHFKNFLWKEVAPSLQSLTCLLPSPVTKEEQRAKVLQKCKSSCSSSIYIRCWNPQPSLPDTSGKCISSRPRMHHHGGVGGRVGTDSRISILRGRKKLRKSLTLKYMLSYFRSFLNSKSMKKAAGRTMEGCEQNEGDWQLKDGVAGALLCPLSMQWVDVCQNPWALIVGQCLYSVQCHSIHLKWQRKSWDIV